MRDWFYKRDHGDLDLETAFITDIVYLITQLSKEKPLYGPPWISIIDQNSQELFFNRVSGDSRQVFNFLIEVFFSMSICGCGMERSKGTNTLGIESFWD